MEREDYLNAAFAVFERRLDEFEALVEKVGISIRWSRLIIKTLIQCAKPVVKDRSVDFMRQRLQPVALVDSRTGEFCQS